MALVSKITKIRGGMKSKALDVEYRGWQLMLVADDFDGSDMEVWIRTGELTASDFTKIDVMEHVYDDLLETFREAFSINREMLRIDDRDYA